MGVESDMGIGFCLPMDNCWQDDVFLLGRDRPCFRHCVGEEENGEFLQSTETFVKQGGLCRLSITSDEYHQQNPKVAKMLFEFEDRRSDSPLSSWAVTKQFIQNKWAVDPEEPTIDNTRDSSGRKKKLSRFEQIIVTLMFFTKLLIFNS